MNDRKHAKIWGAAKAATVAFSIAAKESMTARFWSMPTPCQGGLNRRNYDVAPGSTAC